MPRELHTNTSTLSDGAGNYDVVFLSVVKLQAF